MKKTITTIFAAAAILLGTSVNAQTITLGVTGGYQTNSFDEFNLSDHVDGFNAGFTGIWSNSSNWGVGADLIYSRGGGQFSTMNSAMNRLETYRVQTDHIRLTPKFHLFFRDLEDNFRPTVFIGPSVGFLARTRDINTGVAYGADFQTVDFAGVIGAGFNLQVTEGIWVNLNSSYTCGLTTLNEGSTVRPDNLKASNLAFNAGLNFSLGNLK